MEFTAILLLATLTEGTTKYLFENTKISSYSKYIALALGIILAFAYDVRILPSLGLQSIHPLFENVVSGVIIGRGSNFVNDLLSWVKTLRGTKTA